MKIVTCSSCGKKIHLAGKCLYCGNEVNAKPEKNDIWVHENVVEEHEKLQGLLNNKAFDQVIENAELILKWMPKCAEIFWIKLLAKNRCRNDIELVRKGVSINETAEYFNAMGYGSSEEKSAYKEIGQLIEKVRTEFVKMCTHQEYEEKRNTSLLHCQSEAAFDIQRSREIVFDLWTQLKQIEHEMYCIEQDCKLLIVEHKTTLEQAKNDAAYIKNKMSKQKECTSDEAHKMEMDLQNILNQSEQSRKAIDIIKEQHPRVQKYVELTKKRNQIATQISDEISKFQAIKKKMQVAISQIEKIEDKYKNAKQYMLQYDARNMYSVIGEQKYEEVLHSAGLAIKSTDYI